MKYITFINFNCSKLLFSNVHIAKIITIYCLTAILMLFTYSHFTAEKIIICPSGSKNISLSPISGGYSYYNCVSVEVITNILLVIYLLVAVVLLFNLLIAILK